MSKTIKSVVFSLITILFVLLCTMPVFAHPGRTDNGGGHYDYYNNVSVGAKQPIRVGAKSPI